MAYFIKLISRLTLAYCLLLVNSVFASEDVNQNSITAAVIKNFAPQYVTINGKASGFAIDSFNEIADIAGIKVKYLQFDTWAETHQSIADGLAIVIPNVGIIAKRKVNYDFTSPLETFPISIFVRSSNLTINNLSDLSGKHIGLIKRNVAIKIMENSIDVEKTIYPHLNVALFALLSGEVDAIIYPKSVVEYYAKEIGVLEKIKTTGEYLKEVKRGIAIKKGMSGLTKRLDQATKIFLNSPKYQAVYAKWYAAPEPFWNTSKVIMLSILIVFVLIVVSMVLHSVSLKSLNLSLTNTIKKKEKTEKELIKAKEAADNANVAKSQFLSNMSHEIRTPMNGVFGMVQLLEETPLNKEQKEYTETIMHCGDNLLTIINDILDLSKLESGKVIIESIPFNLEQLTKESINLIKPKANQKEVFISLNYDAKSPNSFLGDPTRIRQILFNLLGNAIKFTEQGGVTVSIDYRSTEQVLIEVKDTGIGIKKEALERVFHDFTQADASTTRAYGGSGLGLPITQKLVQAMDGEITVNSVFGEGSTFSVRLKLPVAAEQTKPDVEHVKVIEQQFNGRVLLAEDVLPNQLIAKTLLGKLGVIVDVVDNGVEAITAFENKHYDLIFMDCRMPELDGYEATKEIRTIEKTEQKPAIPIIALTANATLEDRTLCLDAGMTDLIPKPYKKSDLAECLAKFLN